MKKLCAGITLFLAITFFAGLSYSQSASMVATGKNSSGEYVIPAILAEDCNIKVDDDDASIKLKECLLKLIKNRAEKAEEEARIREIFEKAQHQSMLGAMEQALAAKIYAADYEENVLKKFEENMSGESGKSLGDLGAVGGDDAGGGGEAAAVKEDWMNIAKSDEHIANYVNSQMNKIIAATIIYQALQNISGMDETYLEKE